MKKRTTFYGCAARNKLRTNWYREWRHGLPQDSIRAWVEAIPHAIQEVIRLEGGNEYKEGRALKRSFRGRRKIGELFKHCWIQEDSTEDEDYEDIDEAYEAYESDEADDANDANDANDINETEDEETEEEEE